MNQEINITITLDPPIDITVTPGVGPQGPDGTPGATGEAGPPNILSIGTVTKGDEPAATLDGFSPSQILNLVLPKGDKGDTGADSVVPGPQGIQGVQGPQGPEGPEGPQGPAGDNATVTTIVRNVTPTGSINGSNTAFTVPSTYQSGSLELYKNGVRMKGAGNDYTETSGGFTMTTAPATGTVLLCGYILEQTASSTGVNTITTDATPTGLVNGSNTAFTTGQYIGGSLEVYINGVKQQRTTHFTEVSPANGTFTMSDAPLTGDNIQVNYQTNLASTGSADTLDGYHANSTPIANTIPVLNSSGIMPANTVDATSIVNRTRKLFFGTPRVTAGATGTTNMFASAPIAIPSDWVPGTDVYIKAMVRNNTNGGTVVKTLDAYRFRDGVVYNNISPTISINRSVTDTVSHIITLATWAAANIQHGDVFWITVARLGDNASDTNTGIEEHDVTWLEYTADS